MLKSVEGLYRNGRIELLESPPEDADGQVIITFIPSGKIVDLRERGISEEQAADLRRRLSTIADDWNRPDMDVYDAL